MRYDLHMHTYYCDGADSPEDMILAALDAGFDCIGFSGHSYTQIDESYCMSKEGTLAYRSEIASLAEKYRGRIRVLCGIEQDYWSEESTDGYAYVIGSVHYLRTKDGFFPVDESASTLTDAVEQYYAGDWFSLAEDYFRTVSDVVAKTGADIIGHFDLITKFNEKNALFDVSHPRYRAAWQEAVNRLIPYEKPFEINTGAIARGYRTEPYPSPEICSYIADRGGTFLLSSDSHRKETLGFSFARYASLGPECTAFLLRIPTA